MSQHHVGGGIAHTKHEIHLNTQARLQLLQSGQQPFVRIIDRAIPPENPSKPNVPLILALSLVVGLFGGVFLVFLVGFVRKTRQRLSVNP